MEFDCTKEGKNIYFACREKAAKYNDLLNSRERAAELLGISTSTLAKMLLDMQVPKAAKELKQKLAVMGISEEDFTYQTAVIVGVINQAMKGNTKAASFLRDTVGENPAHELRERELDQKIAEFEYHKQQEEAQRKESESASSLADAIEEAYRNRMEAEKDAEQ